MNFGRQESLGRFVVGEIPEYLMCPVCLGLLDNASQGLCGHVFCRSCIEGIFSNNSSSNACPLCRSTLLRQSIGPNRIAQMLVDKLQVNCPVEDTETGERCEWVGEKGALLAHHYGGECTLLRQIIERTPVPVIRHSSTANYELIPSRLTVYAASHDVCGGGTGREYVRNLASAGTEGWNKWFGGHNLTAATITITLTVPQCVHRYRLRNANDCRHRNPAAWELWGKIATAPSSPIALRSGATAADHESTGASAGACAGEVQSTSDQSIFQLSDILRYARRYRPTSTNNTPPAPSHEEASARAETGAISATPSQSSSPPRPGSWVRLHAVQNGVQFHSYFEWLTYDVADPTADEFDAIQLRITSNEGGNDAQGLQLGAFHLHTLTPFF